VVRPLRLAALLTAAARDDESLESGEKMEISCQQFVVDILSVVLQIIFLTFAH
jgi:hypothetical protein